MSLFEPNFEDVPGSKISTDCENALENGHFAVHFIHLGSKKKTFVRKVHEVCWWIVEAGKSKVEKSLGLAKKQNGDTLLSHWWVQDS